MKIYPVFERRNMRETFSTDAKGNADQVKWSNVAPTRPVKRSFSISGHRTSISLENAFWEALHDIAAQRQEPLSTLVARIDRERGSAGLSGAIRVWLLDQYRERAQR
ncbi:MAG: ribbon-helix-helix domain-containing protein [Hyphomicrobiaceae bacterium]